MSNSSFISNNIYTGIVFVLLLCFMSILSSSHTAQDHMATPIPQYTNTTSSFPITSMSNSAASSLTATVSEATNSM